MTIIDILEQLKESDKFGKNELMQMISEAVEQDEPIEDKIIEVYNAVEDTELMLMPNSIEVIDLVKE